MNAVVAVNVMKRMDAIWPSALRMPEDTYAEWTEFLSEYDADLTLRVLSSLREQCKWRPSMADFRAVYFEVLALADDVRRRALPSGDTDDGQSLRDRFGSDQDQWRYCWRCDMAIALDEWERRMGYDEARGLYHLACPRRGTAPTIPAVQKSKRDKWMLDHHISIGPHVDPVRYREQGVKSGSVADDDSPTTERHGPWQHGWTHGLTVEEIKQRPEFAVWCSRFPTLFSHSTTPPSRKGASQ